MPRGATLGIVLALTLIGCGDDARSPAAADTAPAPEVGAIGILWQWTRTTSPAGGMEAADPGRYTLKLNPDGRAEFRFDCNRGSGGYTLVDGALDFAPMASTRMACPPDSQDAVFIAQLEQVRTLALRDGSLELVLADGAGTMHFEPRDE